MVFSVGLGAGSQTGGLALAWVGLCSERAAQPGTEPPRACSEACSEGGTISDWLPRWAEGLLSKSRRKMICRLSFLSDWGEGAVSAHPGIDEDQKAVV